GVSLPPRSVREEGVVTAHVDQREPLATAVPRGGTQHRFERSLELRSPNASVPVSRGLDLESGSTYTRVRHPPGALREGGTEPLGRRRARDRRRSASRRRRALSCCAPEPEGQTGEIARIASLPPQPPCAGDVRQDPQALLPPG